MSGIQSFASSTLPGAREGRPDLFSYKATSGHGRSAPGTGSYSERGSRLALCFWLPTFELRLELVRSPALDSTSVALLAPGESSRREIWQVSERASVAGVRPGMLVSQAVGLCTSLTLLEPDPAHYDAAMEEMLEALSEMSPIIEPAGRGRVFVGVDGLGRLYGSPRRQVRQGIEVLFQVLPPPLVAALRVGWAPGKFAAWVAAVASGPGQPTLVPEEALARFLAPRPVSALPVGSLMVERLERLGVYTLSDLLSLPEAALVSQFGKEGKDALAWSTGRRIDPVRPWHRPRPIRASLDFPAPVGLADTLHGGVDRLIERGLARPARKGRSIKGVRLLARLEGGGSWCIDAVLREPTSGREAIAFPLRSRMSIAPPPRAVEGLVLEFYDFGAPTSQKEIFGRREEAGRESSAGDLAEGIVPSTLREAVKELKLKLGYSPLYRVVEVDPWSRIPERRHALLSFDP